MRQNETLITSPDGLTEKDQPQWRNDFPIDTLQDEYIERRDFTKFLVLISFAFVVGQVWIVVQNFWRKWSGELPVRKITEVDRLQAGSSMLFQYPNKHDPCVLVKLANGELLAYSQKCTHLSCPVIVKMAEKRFHCPCHEGSFDLETGRPLAGPPRRTLPRIRLQVRDNAVYANGIEEGA